MVMWSEGRTLPGPSQPTCSWRLMYVALRARLTPAHSHRACSKPTERQATDVRLRATEGPSSLLGTLYGENCKRSRHPSRLACHNRFRHLVFLSCRLFVLVTYVGIFAF